MCDKTTDLGHGYPIRSSAIRLQNIVTKEEFLNKQHTTCPKIDKKRKSQGVQVIRQIPRPVGQKGYMSPEYDANTNDTYLQQRFLRINKIGEGSYGAVYSVVSKDDNKTYAVKIVKRYKPPNPLAEINILDKIDGISNCLGYTNAWMENNVLYIQLELASMSLHSYSFKKIHIEEEELFHILINILNALKGMHSIGLLHMDVKPDNILQHPSGRYVLCDFGLSTYYTNKIQPYKTSEGDSRYVSPDMLRGEISPAGDIFALGITLFEVGHGIVLPDRGSDWHNYRLGRNLILPKGVRELSSELTAIISWMMKKDPLQRPTADTLLKHPTLQKYMTLEKPGHISKWRQLDHLACNNEQNQDLANNPNRALENFSSRGRLSWGWGFPEYENSTAARIDSEAEAANNNNSLGKSDKKVPKGKEPSNSCKTRRRLSQCLFKSSTPVELPVDGNCNFTALPATPTQTLLPAQPQKTPESSNSDDFLLDITPLTTLANHRRVKMKGSNRKEESKTKEKSASPKTPTKTGRLPNIPSGGTPQKRRVARQLDLYEEPLKTPKRDDLDSSENISIRLNFDDLIETDDNCIPLSPPSSMWYQY